MAGMVSAQSIASGGIVGVATVAGRDRVVATLQGEGVSCYSIGSQRVIRTWALGQSLQEFASPVVFDPASQRYFAALAAVPSAGLDSVLLSWKHGAEGGTIKQIATQLQLPAAVGAVLPIAQRARRQHSGSNGAAAIEIDEADRPAVFVAHTNGSVSLCSAARVLSENAAAAALPLLAACVDGFLLYTLHLSRTAVEANVTLGSFTVKGGILHCASLQQLAPPGNALRPLTATCAAGRAAVLWSDGSFAIYDLTACSSSPSSAAQIEPAVVRRLQGFRLPLAAAAAAAAANGETPARGGKKRAHGSAALTSGSRAASVAAVAVGEGLVAVAGWGASGLDGGATLRLVCLDLEYGVIHAAADLDATSIGMGKIGMGEPIQAVGMGGGVGKLALAAGGCAVVARCGAEPPALSSLLGALDLSAAGHSQQGAAAACAAAARHALHGDDIAALVAPSGSTGGPLRYSLEAPPSSNAAAAAAEVLVPCAVQWAQPGRESMRAAEDAVWAALLDSAASKKGRSEAQFLALLRSLMQAAQKQQAPISRDLLSKLLLAAVESRHWKGAEMLLAAQHPGSLAGCAGVAEALASSHQYQLLHTLLRGASDVPANDLTAVLRVLLGPHEDATKQAQREYCAGIRAAAVEAVAAAEAATGLTAAAACAAGAVEGFSAAQVCLHPLLAVRHDAAVLLSALRQLTAAQAVALLRYLRRWLHNLRHITGDSHAAAPHLAAIAAPSPAAVLEWTGITIDANLSRLLLRPEAVAVLAAVREEVVPQVAALRQLGRVKGAVEHVQCGAPLAAPPSGVAGHYALEWLDLRVT